MSISGKIPRLRFFIHPVVQSHFKHWFMYQSIPAVPIPPGLRSFPNPGGGAIAEIFQPGGGDLDVFHHGDWRTITWQITLEKILNSFANGLILIIWDSLSVPLSLIIDG